MKSIGWKKGFIILPVVVAGCVQAQCVYVTDSTYVHMFSEEIVEDIDAYSTKMVGAWNICTGKVFFKLPAASFIFANSLMGEHYREQYMETHKYPFIEFRGKMEVDSSTAKRSDGKSVEYRATATGTFKIHGVEREKRVPGTIRVVNDSLIVGRAVFWMVPTDYGIRQPAMLGIEAADSVRITLWFRMVPYRKKPTSK